MGFKEKISTSDCCNMGDRVPQIELLGGWYRRNLIVYTQLGNNGNFPIRISSIESNKWYDLEIFQILENRKVCMIFKQA